MSSARPYPPSKPVSADPNSGQRLPADTLWTLDTPTADDHLVALRRSLGRIRPTRADYATAPILSSFTWAEALSAVAEGRWYLVAFRSRRRPNADADRLHRYDRAALHEAMARSTGLLAYFAGAVDTEGACLSFCLWTDRAHARAARTAPQHRQAVAIADDTYATFTLECGDLIKQGDGRLQVIPVRVEGHPGDEPTVNLRGHATPH